MKTTILFSLLFFTTFLAHAQTTDQIEKYPSNYTMDKVDELLLLKDHEKAVWYLVNIYGTTPKAAEEKIRTLKKEIPELDLFIKKTFAVYSVFDPEIGDFTGGALTINRDKLHLKGSWGDALVKIAAE